MSRGWRSPRTGWVVGALLAVVVNAGVFIGLRPAPVVVAVEPPLRTVTIAITTPPEPAPPVEAGTPAATASPVAAPAAASATFDLPALDLPPTGSPALATGAGPVLGALPGVRVPALALPTVTAPVDSIEPPVLQGGLQLDRFYPYLARARGITGSSRLNLDVDADGAVTEVRIVGSVPAGVFESAATALARTLRFQPARQGGRVVATTTSLTIAWTIK